MVTRRERLHSDYGWGELHLRRPAEAGRPTSALLPHQDDHTTSRWTGVTDQVEIMRGAIKRLSFAEVKGYEHALHWVSTPRFKLKRPNHSDVRVRVDVTVQSFPIQRIPGKQLHLRPTQY